MQSTNRAKEEKASVPDEIEAYDLPVAGALPAGFHGSWITDEEIA